MFKKNDAELDDLKRTAEVNKQMALEKGAEMRRLAGENMQASMSLAAKLSKVKAA